MIGPDEFLREVACEFKLDKRRASMDANLVEDLGLDSLDCYELVLFVEELSENCLDETFFPEFPMLETLADAYKHLSDLGGKN